MDSAIESTLSTDAARPRCIMFDLDGVVANFRMAMAGEPGDSPYKIEFCRPIVDGIDRLRAFGVMTALITNNDRFSFEAHFPDVNLNSLFDVVVFSSDIGAEKPNARVYNAALKQLGLSAQETVFIDDVAHNVDGATAIGIRGVLADSTETVLNVISAALPND